ncbi:TPA: hypothetical protein N0F65_001828 [Lagenidium giganteum]|uniref:RNA methyltransferase n=1 Tax=Lagenidium giganteum TaxID=4803 RepID=A0AAV2Z7N4_9STRA|nr:TPA: hypothetical protein N0F65_001828 [Lagenidium giganteum]
MKPEHSVDVVNFDQQHVSALNEWAQSAKRVVTYEFTEGGTQHRKHFACDLKVDGDLYGHGEGVSKKVAKAKAAGEALRKAKGSDESALVTTTLTAEEAPMVSLEKRKQLHVLGVDIDDVLIERAAKKPVTLNQPTDAVRFLQADVACASFNDAINSFSAGVKRDSKANTFDLITCFSVTMWIHLNKGDEGLWLFLDRVAAMTDLLIIEPQPWKCYRLTGSRNVSSNACKRLERMRVEVPRSFSELKVREDVIDRITAFLLESGRFRHKALLGKTNWSRPMLLFSKRPIAGLTPARSSTMASMADVAFPLEFLYVGTKGSAYEPHIDGMMAVMMLFGIVVIPPLLRLRLMYTCCWLGFTVMSHFVSSDAALGLATTMGITIMVGWYSLRVFDRYAFTALLNGWLGVWATSPLLGLAARIGDFVVHLLLPMVLISCYLPLVRVWMSIPALICSRIWCYAVVGGGLFPKADHVYRFSPPRSQHFWNAAYKMELLLNLCVPLFCRSFWVYVMTAVAGAILISLQVVRSLLLPKLRLNAKRIMCRLLSRGGIRPAVDFVVRDDSLWLDWMSDGLLAIGESYVAGLWDVNSSKTLDDVITGLMTIPMEARQEMYRSWSARLVALAARMFNYPSSSRGLIVGSVSDQFDLCPEFRRAYMDKYLHQGFGIWTEGSESLEEAQIRKLDTISDALDLKPGHRVLDLCLGSWGGVGCYLTEKNSAITTLCVVSTPQDLVHARKFATELGVFDRMEFLLAESPEKLLICLSSMSASRFDRIVCSGVLETLPRTQTTRFLRTLKRIQASGGITLVDIITCLASRVTTHAWNNKYVHGSFLFHAVTLPKVRDQAIESGFDIDEIASYSDHYEQTYLEWNRRFQTHWNDEKRSENGGAAVVRTKMVEAANCHAADGCEWEKHIDESSNTAYYYNTRTGESSWEEPEGFVDCGTRNPAAEAITETPRWRKYVDDTSGATYYHDEANDVTQWEEPEGYVEATSDVDSEEDKPEEQEDGKQEDEEERGEDVKKADDKPEVEEEEKLGDHGDDDKDVKPDAKTEDTDTSATEAKTPAQRSPWIKYVDATSGKPYFHNTVTNKTQWEEPESFVDGVTIAPKSAQSVEYMQYLNRTRAEQLARTTKKLLDPTGNLDRLNAILKNIDGNAAANDADEASKPKADWVQHVDPQTQRFYYHNNVTGQTQWEKPDAPVASALADWVPPEDPTATADRQPRPTVSGVHYVATAKFNRLTGRYEQLGGEEYWQATGVAPDREGRQMSHFFDVSQLGKNREEAQRIKEQLKRKNIDWKKIEAEKKAKKLKKKNQWLYED